MDGIPFVKVSLEDAKAALAGSAPPAMPRPQEDWRKFRLNEGQVPEKLTREAFQWLASLPRSVRPNMLARRYPRIVNRVAEIWKRPLQCERYLDGLVLDHRGNRKGFPGDVTAEIATLKTHFLATSGIVHHDVWGHRIGVE